MTAIAIIVGVSLLIGCVGSYALRRYFMTAQRSENWLRVPATLLRCEVVERRSDEHHATVYNLDVWYSYQVEAETLESKRIAFYSPEWSTFRTRYTDLQNRLIECERLQVSVNPDNHKECVLIPGAENAPFGLLCIAAVMMFVCPLAGVVAIYLIFL